MSYFVMLAFVAKNINEVCLVYGLFATMIWFKVLARFCDVATFAKSSVDFAKTFVKTL